MRVFKNTVSINKKTKILCLDDELGILDALKVRLESMGYEPDYIDDPYKAIELLIHHKYDILITDYFMEEMNGDEVVKRIREYNKEVFIILLTGNAAIAPPLELMSVLDINYYIEKEQDFSSLLQLAVLSAEQYIKSMKTLKDKEKAHQKLMIERERITTLGELAGGIAHDINNPTAAIEAGLSVLDKLFARYIDNMTSEEEKKNIVEQIQKMIKNSQIACIKIMEIISSVKTQARNLSGELNEIFSINSVVEDMKVMINHSLQKAGCELLYEADGKYQLKGDPGKLSQVLTNLIMNSVDAYDGMPGKIELKVDSDEQNIIISISDNAGGIPENLKGFIFNKILTTKGSKGTGWGLYICHSIIKGHFRGTINYESEIGKGTTFYIYLPLNTNMEVN